MCGAVRRYGKRVEKCVGRHKRGKELYYEVAWETLDVKQNTYEPLSKLRKMGVRSASPANESS